MDSMGASRAVLTQVMRNLIGCLCSSGVASSALRRAGRILRLVNEDNEKLDLQLILLAVALGIGQWLEKKKVDWLGEAGIALLLGIAMGILSRVFTFSKTYVAWMGFQVGRLHDASVCRVL